MNLEIAMICGGFNLHKLPTETGKAACYEQSKFEKCQTGRTETFLPMEPVGTEDGSDVVFVNTALTCKNGTNRGVLFTGKDTGYMYCQGNLGIRYKGRQKKGMGMSAVFAVNTNSNFHCGCND